MFDSDKRPMNMNLVISKLTNFKTIFVPDLHVIGFHHNYRHVNWPEENVVQIIQMQTLVIGRNNRCKNSTIKPL